MLKNLDLYSVVARTVGMNPILKHNEPNIYLCKVNIRNTRKRCEICSKLTIMLAGLTL